MILAIAALAAMTAIRVGSKEIPGEKRKILISNPLMTLLTEFLILISLEIIITI